MPAASVVSLASGNPPASGFSRRIRPKCEIARHSASESLHRKLATRLQCGLGKSSQQEPVPAYQIETEQVGGIGWT